MPEERLGMLEARQKGKIKAKKRRPQQEERQRRNDGTPPFPTLGWIVQAEPAEGKQSFACGRSGWSKVQKAYRLRHPVVDSFDPAFHEIGLIPEAGSLPVPRELLPPLMMRKRTRPALE